MTLINKYNELFKNEFDNININLNKCTNDRFKYNIDNQIRDITEFMLYHDENKYNINYVYNEIDNIKYRILIELNK